MSAGFTTFLEFHGTAEEIQRVLEVVSFCKDNHEDYKNNLGWYFDGYDIKEQSDEFLEVELDGPYGASLDVVEFFQMVADAAPGGEFKGEINGFSASEDYFLEADFKNGKLSLRYGSYDGYAYEDHIMKLCPNKEFCELFHIDPDEFGDSYSVFVSDFVSGAFWVGTKYDDFIEMIKGFIEEPKISREEYEKAKKTYFDKGIMSYINYVTNDLNNTPCTTYIYNPVTQKHELKYSVEEYVSEMMNRMPLNQFKKYFGLTKKEISKEEYHDYIYDMYCMWSFPQMIYDNFKFSFPDAEINKEEFDQNVTKAIEDFGLVSYKEFCRLN